MVRRCACTERVDGDDKVSSFILDKNAGRIDDEGAGFRSCFLPEIEPENPHMVNTSAEERAVRSGGLLFADVGASDIDFLCFQAAYIEGKSQTSMRQPRTDG